MLLLGAYIREMKRSAEKRFKAALLITGEGNGAPLQYSCLENPMNRRACRATVDRIAKKGTQLKQLSMYVHTYIGRKNKSGRV